ncbi:MAG: multiheme c-type cytochrome [Nitrospirota bacterium]
MLRLCEILFLSLFIFLSSQTGLASADSYWQRPISPQQSLHPNNCKNCHKAQYDAWKGSLHSKAMSHGLMGQLNPDKKPEFAASCYFCHAPLSEQSEIKAGSRVKGEGSSEYIKNPTFDNKLKHSGVSCSVCHLREGKVYGPPLRLGQGSMVKEQEKTAHNGFIEKDFFEQAEFCAACHQMDKGYELNGKVLTNTYREWKESIYGKNNITCQRCHMPDRQHLFRGIHDPEMVRKGVGFEIAAKEIRKDSIRLSLIITNSGVGHYFPTYTTPLIIIKGFIIDGKGKMIKDTIKESYIGRKVSLDLEQEHFDTRIPPKGFFNFEYENILNKDADRFIIEVKVYPDRFYNEFYKSVLKDSSAYNKGLIKEALKATEKSVYILYRKEIDLKKR